MSHPLAALASVVLTVSGLVLLLADCASACSCGGYTGAPTKPLVEMALGESGAVFSGEVVDFDNSASPATATLRVSEVWKGPEKGTLKVNTAMDPVLCGYPFKEGQEYLVYAYGKQGPFKVNLCSDTKQLSKAGAELALLGKLGNSEKPTRGEVLSDTSGGVSARAMVGVAGLALAASLLVVARLVRAG